MSSCPTMGRIVVFVVLIMSCLLTIEAAKSKNKLFAQVNNPSSAETGSSCVPGKFYQGPGCSKCYCSEKRTKVCGPPGICKLSNKAPSRVEIVGTFDHVDIDTLPALPNQGSPCTPGAAYRVDCNRCICLEHSSLLCEMRMCPSFDDVNRIKAMEMSGQPCQEDLTIDEDCVECSCSNGTTVCKGQESCVPMTKLKNKRPLRPTMVSENKCTLGKRYRLKNSTKRCVCLVGGMLRCPRVEKFDPAFLKAESNKKCKPGVIYTNDCNTCKCGEGGTLKCTLMTCLTDKKEKQASGVIKIEQFDEEFLIPGGKKCTPGVLYERECNTCTCTEDYALECTLIACIGKDEKQQNVDKLQVDKELLKGFNKP